MSAPEGSEAAPPPAASPPRARPAGQALANVLAITRRELGAFFNQPAAAVFIAGFLVVAALLGLRGFFERNVADLRDYFSGLRYAFVLLAPAAAMRLWSEERRSGTVELLLTLPIRPWQAVVGKYLAGLVVLSLALVLGTLLPISLAPYGAFDVGQLVTGYLGAFLLAGAFLAIGLLASALTRSQEVAFLVAALVCVVLNLLGDPVQVEKLAQYLPRDAVLAVADLAIGPHYESLTRGLVETRSLVYFGGLTGAVLFWTVLAVERRARSLSEPIAAAVLVGAALVLGVNLSGQRELAGRVDLSSRGVNSLSASTRSLIDGVKGKLIVRAYLSRELPESTQPHVRRLLDLLDDLRAYAPDRVSVEVIDPGDDPELQKAAERQGVTQFSLQVQRKKGGVDFRKVYAGIVAFYEGKPPAAIPVALDSNLNLEYELALSIRRVLLPRRVVGLAGPRTNDMAALAQALERGYAVKRLQLEREKQIPEYISALIVAAPTPPGERVLYVLDQFVARGGRLIVLAEAHRQTRPWVFEPQELGLFGEVLEGWGLALGPGLLLQKPWQKWPLRVQGGKVQVQADYPWFMGPTGATCPPNSPARRLGRMIFPWASEVRAVGALPQDGERLAFVTSEPAWSASGPQSTHPARRISIGPEVPRTPRVIAAGVRGKLTSRWANKAGPPMLAAAGGGDDPLAIPLAAPAAEGRVVLIGDLDFLSPQWLNQSSGIPLMLNVVDWCLNDGSLAEVRARGAATPLKEPNEDLVRGLNLVALPLLVLILGLGRLLLLRRSRGHAATALRNRLAPVPQAGP